MSPGSTAACATCGSTTPTRPRRRSNTSSPSSPTSNGAHPALQAVDGKPDYYLAPVDPSGLSVPVSGLAAEPFYASDYFDALYEYALELIRRGRAYVCDLSAEDTEKYRGAPDRPGQDSPFRNRSVAENLDLFQRMKAGEFPDGARSLRSKIDMASPNMWLRDPLLYRIRHIPHYHAGAKWCIYPLYDYAHCLSDYLEGVSHSLCSLEFVAHRALYDWVLENLGLPRPLPHQYEFAKLVPTYTLLRKSSPAGTTLACPPYPASAGAAFPPARSASSSSASA